MLPSHPSPGVPVLLLGTLQAALRPSVLMTSVTLGNSVTPNLCLQPKRFAPSLAHTGMPFPRFSHHPVLLQEGFPDYAVPGGSGPHLLASTASNFHIIMTVLE